MRVLLSGENSGDSGNTALSPEEQDALIPNLATKEELNEWERLNILQAYRWALTPKNIRRHDHLTEPYIRLLHHRMFDQTWTWAGTYRTTEKNIGIRACYVTESIAMLLGDARFWCEHASFSPDEMAIRFHHRLVSIHPFANGNGRHARLIADALVQKQGEPIFSWGGKSMIRAGDCRRSYIQALKAADDNDIQPLVAFARS